MEGMSSREKQIDSKPIRDQTHTHGHNLFTLCVLLGLKVDHERGS